MAVNGGGRLTIDYRRAGFLPAQRHVDVAWQRYAAAPDVVLVPVDSQVTVVNLTSGSPMQVARGSPITDEDGTRRATVLFPPGVLAHITMPDGSTQPLTAMSFRATEYTVGPQGPRAMPGELPPSSMYTYAVELGADEALAAGAKSVVLSQPVFNYVENFLGFPVGTIVPNGYYDRDRGTWVASENGRVVRITGISAGLATVDSVGAGALPPLALDADERQQLALLYPVGQELWRVPISHFTPWDHNWPYAPPPDAVAPEDAGADARARDAAQDDMCEVEGSTIGCQNQALGETVPVAGTPYALTYWSDRVPGRTKTYDIDVTLSGASVPASLRSIALRVSVAGQQADLAFPAAPHQTSSFKWDGRDAYGRSMQGGQVADLSIDYTYPAVYTAPSALSQAFARYGGSTILTPNRASAAITVSTPFRIQLGDGLTDARAIGLGGWTFDVHHTYDVVTRTLHRGDGRRRQASALGHVIDQVAISRQPITTGSGANGLAVGPDKSVYYIDALSDPAVVYRVAPDGTETIVAGGGRRNPAPPPPYGEGGPAVGATLFFPSALAVGSDGSLHILDAGRVILRVGADGIIRRVAGNSRFSNQGTPCPGPTVPEGAIAAETDQCIQSFAVAADGTIYFMENRLRSAGQGNFVKQIGLDGRVTTFAGNGNACPSSGASTCGDGGPAPAASFISPFVSLAVAPDGSVLLADGQALRRVGTDGVITTIAGSLRQNGLAGDGGPARDARFCNPVHLAVAQDGAIYVNDLSNQRIRRISPTGGIATFAGSGTACNFSPPPSSGNGGAALSAVLQNVFSVAAAPDGDVYVLDSSGGGRTLRRIRDAFPGIADADLFVPSEDGAELYAFDRAGKHRQTLDALTGGVLRAFVYDAAGRLASVVEKTGGTDNVTTIQRDANGEPAAIVAPFGHVTQLAVDANGYLASIVNPAGETHLATQTAGGLITTFVSPGNRTRLYQYDAEGRLTQATDPAGSVQTLGRSSSPGVAEVTRTTALGRITRYVSESLANGGRKLRIVAPDATQPEAELRGDRVLVTRPADGTVDTATPGPDPRFGMLVPFAKGDTTALPSALTLARSGSRTASLAIPGNPLSLVSQTETSVVNGRTTSS
ncbi:MAG: hypothetical protein KJ018_13935, partial [Burkholderiales bacterium]|nr:hypothetical protein [Burkholderiales bacterium]